ncbi:CYTH domain-containing protein [Pseudoxanthobacter sp.]|uniref:CYTH domain-containing protein n=1 Tax=Pseudoxanthobacter sp. TaxID=1925742 RepID=UPI002FDF2DD8
MALEIERKFLVSSDDWRNEVRSATPIRQGYFVRTPMVVARIRVMGDKAFITVKGAVSDRVRHEFEYEIPHKDAEEMLKLFHAEPVIEKTRHEILHDGSVWVVDEFAGPNEGLVLVEIELTDPDQPFSRPRWLGQEVTGDPRYQNSNLVRAPYCTWPPRR